MHQAESATASHHALSCLTCEPSQHHTVKGTDGRRSTVHYQLNEQNFVTASAANVFALQSVELIADTVVLLQHQLLLCPACIYIPVAVFFISAKAAAGATG